MAVGPRQQHISRNTAVIAQFTNKHQVAHWVTLSHVILLAGQRHIRRAHMCYTNLICGYHTFSPCKYQAGCTPSKSCPMIPRTAIIAHRPFVFSPSASLHLQTVLRQSIIHGFAAVEGGESCQCDIRFCGNSPGQPVVVDGQIEWVEPSVAGKIDALKVRWSVYTGKPYGLSSALSC